MAIDSYAGLKTAIQDWLLDQVDESTSETLIHLAEQALRRDRRVRRQIEQSFTVDSESESLPSRFVELESLYHDGSTYYHEIDTVSADHLAEIKRRSGGEDGAPTHAALIDGSSIRFAPVPDEAYDLRLVWWETIPHLSDSAQSNWLLDDNSDIYLYAALVESAPYLHDEERLPMWRSELERRLVEMHKDSERKRYSGSLVKQAPPIG